MNTVFKYLPEVDGNELHYLNELFKDFDDDKARDFSAVYRSRRRDPNMILLTTLVGFLGFAGIQRFLTDQIGLGILYLLTAGLCFIGTIVDAINYKQIAADYNRKVAYEVASMFSR
jgi:TM2 domain-containing membrane protein YozV